MTKQTTKVSVATAAANAKAIAAKAKADAVQARKALPALKIIATAIGSTQADQQAASGSLNALIAVQCKAILDLKICTTIIHNAMAGSTDVAKQGVLYAEFSSAVESAYLATCKTKGIAPDMIRLANNIRSRCADIRKVIQGSLKQGVDIQQFLAKSVDADGVKRERGAKAKTPDGKMFVSFSALKEESFAGLPALAEMLTCWCENPANKTAKPKAKAIAKMAADLLAVVSAELLKNAKAK